MKHTKCKICGKEHALGGCPEFRSSEDNAKLSAGRAQKLERQLDPMRSVGLASKSSKALFNRNAYQAQYMRWKRAADKLGMTVAEYRKEKDNGD